MVIRWHHCQLLQVVFLGMEGYHRNAPYWGPTTARASPGPHHDIHLKGGADGWRHQKLWQQVNILLLRTLYFLINCETSCRILSRQIQCIEITWHLYARRTLLGGKKVQFKPEKKGFAFFGDSRGPSSAMFKWQILRSAFGGLCRKKVVLLPPQKSKLCLFKVQSWKLNFK